MTVLPNWSVGNYVRPVPREENPLNSTWNLGDDFVVAYSGNLGRAHDEMALIYVLRKFPKEPHIQFIFIGGGPKIELLKQIAKNESITNARFFDYQPLHNLANSLSVANVHIVTLKSNLEGLIVPSKFYGVAAAGRPVVFIGNKDGELARIITSRRCGIVVGENDYIGLVNAITTLRSNQSLADQLGANAREYFAQECGADHAIVRWKNLLGSL